MAGHQETITDPPKNDSESTELPILFTAKGSSCSQKVLLALYEKKIPFQERLINLLQGENFAPWFMALNRRGEVPVFVHNKRVICDSACILEYLEEVFVTGTPSLRPHNVILEFTSDIKKVERTIKEISLPLLTFGTVCFPELTSNAKISKEESQNRLEGLKNRNKLFDDVINKYPEFHYNYELKKNEFRIFHEMVQDIEIVSNALDDLEAKMDFLELHLSRDQDPEKKHCWIVSENFSHVDISMVLLLHRLEHLGLSERYFSDGKRPNIETYYQKAQLRDAFKKTFMVEDDDFSVPYIAYISWFVVCGAILFAVTAACAHLRSH